MSVRDCGALAEHLEGERPAPLSCRVCQRPANSRRRSVVL